MITPLTPPPRRAPGPVTIGDHIDAAVAGSSIRIDLHGVVIGNRVSAYVTPGDALRFAVELSRLARSL